ncbi:MAG: DUF4190 domain-containing protein, partial [Thermoactinospora sp.]|nr:DUF4190 domain-containing protein [Thermoactinospora sp.]
YPGWGEEPDEQPTAAQSPSRYDPPTAPQDPAPAPQAASPYEGGPREYGQATTGAAPYGGVSGQQGDSPYTTAAGAGAGAGAAAAGAAAAGAMSQGGQTPGSSQTSGSSQTPAGSTTPGSPQTPGSSQAPGSPQTPGGSQTPTDPYAHHQASAAHQAQEPGPTTPGGFQPQGGAPHSQPGGGGYSPPPPPPGQYPGSPYQGGKPQDWQPQKPGAGLAVASLILGVASIFLLVVCGLGTLTAIVGLILGIVAVAKGVKPAMAWAGIGLSLLALILAVAGFVWFMNTFGPCFELMPDQVQRCMELKWNGGRY